MNSIRAAGARLQRASLRTALSLAAAALRTALSLKAALLAAALLVAAGPASAATVTASSTYPALDTAVGRHIGYQARIANAGSAPTGPLLVHLNIASMSSDVYVDPEDWSTDRSRFLPALAPGAATSLSWDLQAVSPGTFSVYAVVLPDGTAPATAEQRLVVSSPTTVTVTARRTLNAGGSLPVVLAVPALLALVTAATRARNRSRNRA